MPVVNEETTNSLIDTALASGSAAALDPEERALQELVLTLRDDAPVAARDFRLRMDARVAAGFPPRQRRLRLPAAVVGRPRLAALGAAASVLLALIVAGALIGRGGSNGGGPSGIAVTEKAASPAKATGGTALEAAPTATAVSPTVTPIEPPIGPPAAVRGGSNRRVQQSAQLVLAAQRDRLSQVGDQVVAVTDRYRGIVMSSSVTDTGSGEGSGYFDLRIPVRNLSAALRDLSQLADVQSRTENTLDVTASFVNARTRIQELRAERKGLLNRLAAATTDNQVAAIRARLRVANAALDHQMRALQLLSRRTSLATVSVTLAEKHGKTGGAGGISKGWRDLRHSLADSAALALRVLGVAIPIALLVALLWAGNAWATRRRRETALDRL